MWHGQSKQNSMTDLIADNEQTGLKKDICIHIKEWVFLL